jgi:hypothetical protein
MRYQGQAPRTTTFGRAPRRTNDKAALKKIYERYIRMGFEPHEARSKAWIYHTSKL